MRLLALILLLAVWGPAHADVLFNSDGLSNTLADMEIRIDNLVVADGWVNPPF